MSDYTHQHLRLIVIHSLDTFNYRNAEFACERLLCSDEHNHEFLYLYCLTLFRQGRHKSVYNRLVDTIDANDNLGCAFVFAQSCKALSKYKEGVFQLLKVAHLYNDSSQEDPPHSRFAYEHHRSIYPDLSLIYHLLGDLYKAMGDTKNSALNYSHCLKYNQFDFEAFQELCKLGVSVKVKNIFKTSSSDVVEPPHPAFPATPIPYKRDDIELISTPRVKPLAVPDAPLRKSERLEFPKPNFLIHSGPPGSIDNRKAKREGAYSKITSRLISQPKMADTTNSSTSTEKRPRSLKRNLALAIPSHTPEQPTILANKEMEVSEHRLLKLYVVFAKGFKAMAKYDCYKAIRIFELLPEHEKNTPWVLAKLGRLHYEIVNYKQLEHFFTKLRKLDRTRLEDMEYYSTLLWHLQKRVDLTYLANELHDLDKDLAVTWCVIGNLFSLTREPDEAIKCFTKSIKLDENFTYAYTLKGHEYFGNDNYEMALENFRISLLIDPRHYNALYGIGMVYINLGDYQKADYHFRKAVAINPVNIILICCTGMVLEKLGKKNLALRQYELANKLQPLSALPLFKKAQLLFSMQQFPQALKTFEHVKDLAPNEASVHFLLGQLYNIQNDKFLAIREFTIALNLDPKGNYLIREAMESLKEN